MAQISLVSLMNYFCECREGLEILDGGLQCKACGAVYEKKATCNVCSAVLERLNACGATNYFCNQCNELKSKKTIVFSVNRAS